MHDEEVPTISPAEAERQLVSAVEAGDLEGIRAIVRTKALSPEKLASNTFNGPSDFLGESLLHIAVFFGHVEVIKFLIDSANADVNLPSRMEHVRPLHIACRRGFVLISQLLLGFHADLNAQQNNNQTPLHMATLSGNVDLVKYLVNLGARLDVEGSDGHTALGLATMNDKYDIVRVLTEAERDQGIFSAGASGADSHAQPNQVNRTATNTTALPSITSSNRYHTTHTSILGHNSHATHSTRALSPHTFAHPHLPVGWRGAHGRGEYQPIRALVVRQAGEESPHQKGRFWGTKKPPYAQHDCTHVAIDDEDLRSEFAKYDTKGRGWISKQQFKEIYAGFEHFGTKEMEIAALDHLLSGFNLLGEDRLSYEEFAVIMLRLARA